MRSASSAGPFTATYVVASNLSVGFGVIVVFSYWAHLTASARLRVRTPGPISGRLSTTTNRRSWSVRRGFPSPFGHRHSLLGHPVPAEELSPPRGRLTGHAKACRTSTGLPRSARMSCDRGGCPLYPGDNGAHPDRGDFRPGARRFAAASPCAPPTFPPARILLNEASEGSHEVHRVSRAHCCARLPSEPDEHLSMHPAQASPKGSRADRSAGRLPRWVLR